MIKIVVLAILSIQPVFIYCCRDGIDNVIDLADCGEETSIVRFRNMKIFTYDANKQPKCSERKGLVIFPGYIKLSSGQIDVNETLELTNSSALLYFTLRKNDFFVNNVCKRGASSHFAMPIRYCKPDLCATFGANFCALVNNKGVHNLDELAPTWHQFVRTDISDIFANLLLKGQWRGEVLIYHRDAAIGCLSFPPNNRQWINVHH